MDFLKSEFREKIRKDMQALPQIKPDRSSAPSFFSDPTSKAAIQLIDLLNMNLAKFSTDLRAFHDRTKSTFQDESAKIMISRLTDTQRVDFLDSIDTELSSYADHLWNVQDNLEAIKDVSPKWLAAAQDAEKLVRVFNGQENPITDRIITKELFDAGMSVEEMAEVSRRCEVFARDVRSCLKEVDALLVQVKARIQDVNGWRDAVSKARGIIMQSIWQAELNRRQSGLGATP